MFKKVINDPHVFNGKPILEGTLISVSFILWLLACGKSITEIITEYPDLSEEDIKTCLRYAAVTLKNAG
ncbi:MAG: DUF433 domain-containing protein [Spirochaetes bacterium]|nr:DUF433 domain-containing protein [Spirochaetota bacterium]